MKYIIKFGRKELVQDNLLLNVTYLCLKFLCVDNVIFIPGSDDIRANIFGDPNWGFYKSVFICDQDNKILETADAGEELYIDCVNNIVYKNNVPENIKNVVNKIVYPEDKLRALQNELVLKHGYFHEEYPEQLMATSFLKGNENVLEIGANVGRNSLIIGQILRKYGNKNLVCLETDINSFEKLKENRDVNGLEFYIENSALSKKPLIQNGWDTIQSNIIKEGWTPVNTITFNEICEKYKIQFDTIVADCEGALLPILLDMPEVLTNIKLIITENDYKTAKQKACLDYILEYNGFHVVYSRPLGMVCYLELGCKDNFYEVWEKNV